MCGIAGIYYFDGKNPEKFNRHQSILDLLAHRGPDNQQFIQTEKCFLYHTRLSIIDTSDASNQPFSKNDTHLVFNGEVFNYKDLRRSVEDPLTEGDVEVMHFLTSQDDLEKSLNSLNGYFSFATYKNLHDELIIGRDRLGIKPLYYYKNADFIAFASELKALVGLCGPQPLNLNQTYSYFRLNYCAGNQSVLENIYQVPPGYYLKVKDHNISFHNWYHVQQKNISNSLENLLDDSIKLRLIADVPVGCFLSGGVDSSVIAALATRHHPKINTFSVGFEDERYFDETQYAQLVAKHIGSEHHTINLNTRQFFENFYGFLNSMDEPFADSSAFNVFMLSKYTRKHVKVALSGDGADELFKGYNKHRALIHSEQKPNRILAKTLFALASLIPESRNSKLSNKIRQMKKFRNLVKLSETEKLKYLAQISSNQELKDLFLFDQGSRYFDSLFEVSEPFSEFDLSNTIDIQVILKDDMLVKADRFSMSNGLELRNPFLDYRIIEYALNLPENKKIRNKDQKVILKETFSNLLPKEIFERKKKGFELPLWKWMNEFMKINPNPKWFDRDFIFDQNLFRYPAIESIRHKALSNNPGDSPAKLYAYIVFQNWYLQNKSLIKNA